MNKLSIKKELNGTAEDICARVIEVIKPAGFGILTRIDFDQKIKEKLNETIGRTIILGACNPQLALEAYRQSTDVALFLPCNIVIREFNQGKVIVEAIRPTVMLEFLKTMKESESISLTEKNLEKAILSL